MKSKHQNFIANRLVVHNCGQHAAAVIISADDLTKGTKGNLCKRSDLIVSNWDMEDSEYVGLMKLDVLGLNTLSVLNEAKKMIKQNCDEEIIFEEIPLDDRKVFKEIAEGSNTAVFQIGTWSTDKLAKQIKATNIFLLSDLIALVRPGTMNSGMTDIFLKRKDGKRWERKNSVYEQITKDTYGIIVYQEQVMEVIYKIAGLPYSTADKIRKIISKKRDAKEFKQYEDMFIEGCLKTGYFSKGEALDFWEMLQSHASYSFNKSHSIEYAIIAYWTAYIKYYWPTEFICANLNCGSDGKKEEYIEEAYRLNLKVELPSKENSHPTKWIVKDKTLYAPLIEIKGVGEKLALKYFEGDKKEIVIQNKVIKREKKKPTVKGFFDLDKVEIVKVVPVTAKEEKKNKIDLLLEEIEMFKDTDVKKIQKYFSFRIKEVETRRRRNDN